MIRKKLSGCFLFMKIAAISTCCLVSGISAKTDVPLFLLSGQSNMTGMQNNYNDLTADQKKIVDNVKIYLDMEGDASKMKKWSTLGPGFGSSGSCLGPELFFGRTLSDSMPGKKIAFIKVAKSGTYLGKATEWLPPSSNNGTGGTYYQSMMTSIDAALKAFNSAFDTTQYAPKWAGFVWLQGEFDAMDQTLADKYETNLTNLIKDIRTKTGVNDFPIILPMIDVQSRWTYNSKVRAADIAVKNKLENVDTMDTKGLPSNGIHYSAAGQVKIGTISAQRWLNMDYFGHVPVVYYSKNTTRIVPLSITETAVFDLTGRKLSPRSANFEGKANMLHIAKDGNGYRKVLRLSGFYNSN